MSKLVKVPCSEQGDIVVVARLGDPLRSDEVDMPFLLEVTDPNAPVKRYLDRFNRMHLMRC